MKKYQFTLEKLRSYKKQMMERERNRLLALRTERNQTEERLEQLIAGLDAAQVQFQKRLELGTDVRSMQLFQMEKDANLEEQHEIRAQLRAMDANIERQRRVVVKVSQEVSGLDKLEEEQRAEYQKLSAKESEAAIEEFLSFKLLGGAAAEA